MEVVTVLLSKALICFAGQCHPALVGSDTPVGQYPLIERRVLTEGYGGVVVQFKEDEKMWYAIHRPWRLGPVDRDKVLQSKDPSARRLITKGCINVEDKVFDNIMTGSYRVLEIKP